METGILFAIGTAAAFALSQVLVRRATYGTGESFSALTVSVLVSLPVLAILLTAVGQWDDFLSLRAEHYGLLAGAGLTHLVFARFLYFTSTRLIGANPTAAIARTSVVFSIVFGIVFLGERITGMQLSGAVIIMVGAILTNTEITRRTFRISTAGLLMGFGTAVCASISAVLIRPVMQETDAVYAATAVMYFAAGLVISVIALVDRRRLSNITGQPGAALGVFVISGIILVGGHLLRFSALEHAQVSIVQPVIATTVLFVLLFSWLGNRRIDVFNWRVLAGVIMVMGGMVLIYL